MEEDIKYCAYCGKEIEDIEETGSLCYDCYIEEYYG
jgi:NMD protein affecting ribosome stability and mRNA decay